MAVAEVQSSNGKFYKIDMEKGVCSCSGFRSRGKCHHVEIALDFVRREGKRNGVIGVQALHKEIMRGDQERSLLWARALSYRYLNTPEKIIDVLKQTCFRYTRNFDLWQKLNAKDINLKELILLPTRSKKVWESDLLADQVTWLAEGFELFQTSDWANKKTRFFRDMIEGVREPHLAYELVFASTSKPRWDKAMIRIIYDRAVDEKKWDVVKYIEAGIGSTFHERLALMENLIGLHVPEEMNTYVQQIEVKTNYIPNLPNYVFDCETKIGLKRLVANWKKVRAGKPIPALAKIDLRWSNQSLGLLWRFIAHEFSLINSQNIVDIEWEEPLLPQDLWEKALELDKFFHPQLVKALPGKE